MKPGWRTSEFWITVVANLINLAVQSGLFPDEGTIGKGLAFVSAALATLGYSAARSAVKMHALKAGIHYIPPVKKTQSLPVIPVPPTAGILMIGLSLLLMAAVSACCHVGDTACRVQTDIVDCSSAALKAQEADVLPEIWKVALGGAPDWQAQLVALEKNGTSAVLCAAAHVISDLTAGYTKASLAPERAMAVRHLQAYVRSKAPKRVK